MKFDLYRLGAREFENLTQAISVAELGPDITVFGMGSDGGREATQDENNDGGTYTVLQVKYKENSATAQAEATWLIKEVKKEFKEWRESDKRGKKPKKFILATNVTLTATPRSGGIDRVAKVMREECLSLGIDEWTVWHSENINRFLEKNPGIRTSYAAWILPGDILTAIYEDVTKRNSGSARAIRSYVPKELLNDRYANLDQAGSADDRTVPLADVFFDVPIGLSPDRNTGVGERCLKNLIASCDIRHSADEQSDIMADSSRPPLNRFVLVGGPGQGKSTVSQYLCQLYRAQLVKDTSSMRNAEVRSAVSQIITHATRDGLLPKARRWPINVPLTRLADELAQGKCANLFDYIAQRVSEASTARVTPDDMRNWLQTFPWLLVLDGLDEVPGSSNRGQVLSQISAFQLEADELNADLVVVATTRPQGYTDDFSPKHFVHYYLTALDTASALRYGKKLADARHGNSSERVNRLMGRLERAAGESSTAHLMGTPLQVTIMAVLLDRVGKAPKDRFTLFADYYRVIFERELEKEGASSNLLRDHKTDIDSIHADVGLLLQTRSERSGETESRLTIDEVDSIIKDRLASEGHIGAELEYLTSAISRAATHRLVFLVPSRDTEVSFEIRSLQEFWAADALMNCAEEEIGRRLRIMAVNSHWRNVLLFALGNIFATRRNNLRDSVVALVSELNSHSEAFGNIPRRIATGSRLAVEILNDGMVRAPRYEAVLVEESLKLLSLPYSEHLTMLATSISDRGLDIIRDHLSTLLPPDSIPNESTLAFLASRAGHGDIWAHEKLLSLHDRATPKEQKFMFNVALTREIPALLHVSARSATDPSLMLDFADQFEMLTSANYGALLEPKGCSSAPPWFRSIVNLFSNEERRRYRLQTALRIGPFHGQLASTSKCRDVLVEAFDLGFPHDHWLTYVLDFCNRPDKDSLAVLIRHLGPHSSQFSEVAFFFPWVIYYAVQLYEKFGETAAEMISNGHLGDTETWEEIAKAWKTEGAFKAVTDDFSEWRKGTSTLLPIGACQLSYSRHLGSLNNIASLEHVLGSIREERQRTRVADHFFRTADPLRADVTPEAVERIYSMADLSKVHFMNFSWFGENCVGDQWVALLDRIGKDLRIGFAWVPFPLPLNVTEKWADNPSLYGLGKISISRGYGSDEPDVAVRQLVLEWERVRNSSGQDVLRRVLCVFASTHVPPVNAEEVTVRLSTLTDIVREGGVSVAYLANSLALDGAEPSRSLILGLADIPEMGTYDRQSLFARMVRLQASAPTEIEYASMRPC
ncbi:NACHT domain-containing protein [Streptomyces xiamenensis]